MDHDTTEPVTGDRAVDEALAGLRGLEARPVRDHVTAFDAVQDALAARLAEQGA